MEVNAESEKESLKEPFMYHKLSDNINFKILVPSIAAGAIIGKGGEAIAQIQKETQAKIKLSKADDFYPGTTERVCLIQGSLDGVTRMHNYIMDRILDRPEHSYSNSSHSFPINSQNVLNSGTSQISENKSFSAALFSSTTNQSQILIPWERHKQVKILVPNCTAGLVIGKKGSYVSIIKEKTGAYIQISQNCAGINLVERSITIAGELDQLRAAVSMVLAKIAEDPQSSSCPNISYAHVRGPVASAHPVGSPFAVQQASPSLNKLAPSVATAGLGQRALVDQWAPNNAQAQLQLVAAAGHVKAPNETQQCLSVDSNSLSYGATPDALGLTSRGQAAAMSPGGAFVPYPVIGGGQQVLFSNLLVPSGEGCAGDLASPLASPCYPWQPSAIAQAAASAQSTPASATNLLPGQSPTASGAPQGIAQSAQLLYGTPLGTGAPLQFISPHQHQAGTAAAASVQPAQSSNTHLQHASHQQPSAVYGSPDLSMLYGSEYMNQMHLAGPSGLLRPYSTMPSGMLKPAGGEQATVTPGAAGSSLYGRLLVNAAPHLMGLEDSTTTLQPVHFYAAASPPSVSGHLEPQHQQQHLSVAPAHHTPASVHNTAYAMMPCSTVGDELMAPIYAAAPEDEHDVNKGPREQLSVTSTDENMAVLDSGIDKGSPLSIPLTNSGFSPHAHTNSSTDSGLQRSLICDQSSAKKAVPVNAVTVSLGSICPVDSVTSPGTSLAGSEGERRNSSASCISTNSQHKSVLGSSSSSRVSCVPQSTEHVDSDEENFVDKPMSNVGDGGTLEEAIDDLQIESKQQILTKRQNKRKRGKNSLNKYAS